MILYHGSSLDIPYPDLLHSRANVDFGKGFYTTPLREQAIKWCGKFKRRGKDGSSPDMFLMKLHAIIAKCCGLMLTPRNGWILS